MNKEEMVKLVGAELSTIRDQAAALTKLCDSLGTAMRVDAAITAVEETKLILEGMKETKESVEKVRKALKLRVQERLKDA